MTVLFEMLFHAWCPPYDPDNFPEWKQSDPVQAYGQYAFEEGFKLAAQLAHLSLDPQDLSDIM